MFCSFCVDHYARRLVEPEGVEPSSSEILMTPSTCLAVLSYGEGSGRSGTPERFLQLVVKRWTVAFHRVFAVIDCRDCVTAVSSPASSGPLLGGELKVARRIGLGVCCLAWIDNGCPCQPPTCLHHLKFPNRNLSAPKTPSSFRISIRAFHSGFKTGRMVCWDFRPEGWRRVSPVMVSSSKRFQSHLRMCEWEMGGV